MEELDAASLRFLDELAVCSVEDERAVSALDAQLSSDDVGLLSSLLVSPASSSVEFGEFNPFVSADGDDASVDASSLLPPVQQHGPVDDEAAADTPTQIVCARPSSMPTKRKRTTRPASYQPNRARNARRHELVALKRTIAEMEQELTRLQEKNDDAAVGQRITTVALSTSSQSTSVWERVAVRQLNERRRAERENERLKDRLQTQLKIARGLEQTLRKRAITQGIEEAGLARQRRVFANTSVQSDELIFEELLKQVHDVYLDADSHFERMGISATEFSCKDTRRRGRSTHALEVETFVNEVLPFDLHKVGKAAWQYFSKDKNYLPYRFHYERLHEKSNVTEHTIIENSGLEIYANNVNARGQRRREVAYLRQRVAEMEQELELVKSGARPKRFMPQPPPTSPNGTPQPPSVWKQVAARQYEERRQAELENERLKTDLETQLNVARSLESILVERSTTKGFEDCGLGGFKRVFGSAADASDGSVFEALLKSVHETYTNAEWLVRQGGSEADNTQRSSHDARMRATERGLLVEIFATDLLPFTLTETSTAAWQYFSYGKNHLSDPFRYYYERLSEDHLSSEDTVLERSAFELMANGVKAAVRTRQVLRRYVEQDRVVVVWSATMQPVEFAGKPFSGFYLRESGCMVLRRRERPAQDSSSEGGDDGPLTVLQSCYFIRPVFQSESGEQHVSTDDADIGKLTECVLSWTAAVIKSWRQCIENILIDNNLNAARKAGSSSSGSGSSSGALPPAISG